MKWILGFFLLFGIGSQVGIASIGGPESASVSRYQPVVGTKGMVVSDDRLASQWGTEILKQGGNAVDAAVATAFLLAVTRPHYASIGGGGFIVYCPAPKNDKPQTCQSIDYREKASSRARRDMYLKNGKAQTGLSQNGALASGVPGTVAGLLYALEKFGTIPREKILTRPIEIAEEGYVFTAHSERAAQERWNAMNPAAREIFGCNQKPCSPGTVIQQKDLAKVLKAISNQGPHEFYQGWIARTIVEEIQKSQGILTLEDFAEYQPKLRPVLTGKFKDYEVVSMAPPSSGGAIVLQLLSFADRAQQQGFLKNGFGSIETLHAITHGMALAFEDRAHYFGDPDFIQIPMAQLLSKPYLDKRWKTFQVQRASLPQTKDRIPAQEPQHTTHLSVIDRDGNAVALTTTVNDNFGSGFVPKGTGIVMNNEMDDFSVQPGVANLFGLVGNEANAIAPKKRPLSSMSPTIVRDSKGNNRIVIGAAGGPRIITSVFLSLLNRLEFGMGILDAVAAPRLHHQWKPDPIRVEKNGFPKEVTEGLHQKGYQVEEVMGLGKVHALERLSNGRVIGAPDPRGEGAAAIE